MRCRRLAGQQRLRRLTAENRKKPREPPGGAFAPGPFYLTNTGVSNRELGETVHKKRILGSYGYPAKYRSRVSRSWCAEPRCSGLPGHRHGKLARFPPNAPSARAYLKRRLSLVHIARPGR
jgi:hypothetical protein